ncbi:Hypothetical protein HVPorG_04816 (plasmid) [Roseomonas mucosa]|uniref:hypothetical protein n=1 Tax=Roseomonas mucosa TaxID=207340 RepID=UPI00220CE626|nr:hypothetical protein [Roseomonas mucosa]QDJ11613.1 Hypothetical protein HVPorG_04816 [Roseomonas mucosa]
MNDVTIARALHMLAIVLWIGGVGLVTTVLLPALRRVQGPAEQIALFEAIEGRFARQARVSILVAGVSGLYMLVQMQAWDRFASLSYWWMHAVVLVWLIFAGMLFVLEPLVLHRLFAELARRSPDAAFRVIQRFHTILLALSLLTVFGAVAGSHGLSLFD